MVPRTSTKKQHKKCKWGAEEINPYTVALEQFEGE